MGNTSTIARNAVARGTYFSSSLINRICTHGRQKHQCLECIPLEKALAKGIVCVICCAVKTRAALCRSCFRAMSGTDEVSFEAIILQVLCFFFGDSIKLGKQVSSLDSNLAVSWGNWLFQSGRWWHLHQKNAGSVP